MKPRLAWAAVALASLTAAACITPTDRSGDYRVEVTPLPPLLLRDSVRLDARVVDGAGVEVPKAVVAFASEDPTVLSVSQEGVVTAVGVGTAILTVSAVGFADASPFTQAVRIRGRLEVDSVLPVNVRFGDTLTIFGVGLEPDSLFSIEIGGAEATAKSFVPADSSRPDGEAELRVWVPPPAERRSALTLLGFRGGLIHPDTLNVAQRDLYEPNDTMPWPLGPVVAFRNPALAFEPRERNSATDADKQPADWYTFENTRTQDRTIVFFSQNLGAQAFGVFITDSLEWWSAEATFRVGPNAWTIGLETYLCGGLQFTRMGEPVKIEEVLFPLSIIALEDLPAGTYHVYAPYFPFGDPAAYELLIVSEYASVLQPDAAEENDYCNVAAPLPLPGPATLSIDNPHDIDWFRASVPAQTTITVTATAANDEADLDLYLVRDFRPDSLVLIAVGSEPGGTESVSATLDPGEYFLVVVDFPGVPTQYTLGAGVTPGPVAPVTGTAASLSDRLQLLREKRAASGPGRPDRLRPRGAERR
jgi:hypothetical protein